MMDNREFKDLDLPSGRTRVHAVGDGPAVLVVHGGPGLNHHYLLDHFVVPESGGRTFYFYDQFGCGDSAMPTGGVTSKVLEQQLVEVASAIMDIDEEPPRVLSHSWGTLLTMLAFSHTASVFNSNFIFVSPMPLTHGRNAEAVGRFVARIPTDTVSAIEELESKHESMSDLEVMRILAPFYLSPNAKVPSIEFDEYNSAINESVFDSIGEYDLRGMSDMFKDSLFIFGEDDFVVPDGLKELSGIASFVTIENCGHFPFAESARAFWRAVNKFWPS